MRTLERVRIQCSIHRLLGGSPPCPSLGRVCYRRNLFLIANRLHEILAVLSSWFGGGCEISNAQTTAALQKYLT